jgi:hypothetical protein
MEGQESIMIASKKDICSLERLSWSSGMANERSVAARQLNAHCIGKTNIVAKQYLPKSSADFF